MLVACVWQGASSANAMRLMMMNHADAADVDDAENAALH